MTNPSHEPASAARTLRQARVLFDGVVSLLLLFLLLLVVTGSISDARSELARIRA